MALTSGEQLHDFFYEGAYRISPVEALRRGIRQMQIKAEQAARHMSPEDARKQSLHNALLALQAKAATHALSCGIIERNSPAFQDFFTSLHIIFTPEQIRKFREDARDTRSRGRGTFRDLAGSSVPTKKELDDSKDFFQKKFEGYTFQVYNPKDPKRPLNPEKKIEHIPDRALLAQHALESRHMRQVLTRLLSETDITPGAARGDLRAILRRHPEIGADIGFILLTKEFLDGIERAQEIRSNGRRVLAGLGRSLMEDMSAIFQKDLKGIFDQLEYSRNLWGNHPFFSFLSLGLVPLRAIVPALRLTFALPRALLVGARDAWVFTKRGNERSIT